MIFFWTIILALTLSISTFQKLLIQLIKRWRAPREVTPFTSVYFTWFHSSPGKLFENQLLILNMKNDFLSECKTGSTIFVFLKIVIFCSICTTAISHSISTNQLHALLCTTFPQLLNTVGNIIHVLIFYYCTIRIQLLPFSIAIITVIIH